MIAWKKRAVVRRLGFSTHRSWWSKCGEYRVCKVISHIGLSGYWGAVYRGPQGEVILSRHKKRDRAEESCEKHKRKQVRRTLFAI